MSHPRDMWMNLNKRRLLRRTVMNGPYGPPDGAEVGGTVTVPAATKLRMTITGTALAPSDLVIFFPQAGTGTDAARDATDSLRAIVETVAGDVVTFSTAPTDLTGISMTGLVLDVIPL